MKKALVVALAVGCVLCLAWVGVSFFGGSKAAAQSSSLQRWEYMVASINKAHIWGDAILAPLEKANGMPFFEVEAVSAETACDAAGASGWELVAVVGVAGGDQEFIFKRPLP